MMHRCDVDDDCDYETKSKRRMAEHVKCFHGVGGELYHCTEDGCDFETRYPRYMPTHLRNVHGIGEVVHTYCDMDGCSFKTKYGASGMKKHMAAAHCISANVQFCTIQGCKHIAKSACGT